MFKIRTSETAFGDFCSHIHSNVYLQYLLLFQELLTSLMTFSAESLSWLTDDYQLVCHACTLLHFNDRYIFL